MTTSFRLISPGRSRPLLEDCASWAEQLHVCAAAPMPRAAVAWLAPQLEKIASLVAGPAFLLMASDLVGPLRQTGALRIYGPERRPLHTEILLAQRGEQFRAMVAWVSLFSDDSQGQGELSTYVEGYSKDEEFVQLKAWLHKVLREAQVPNARLLERARSSSEGSVAMGSPFARPQVPEQASISENESEEEDDGAPFMERDLNGRAELVHQMLIGEGRLKRDKAIRCAARGLRDEKVVTYGRLRKDGELYQAILAAIRYGIGQGWFEEPGRGYFRAVLNELDVDDWLLCLERALETGPTAREQLVIECAERAARDFGLKFQRLPSNGKIVSGIEIAIESALEEELIQLNDEGELEWIGEDGDDHFDDDNDGDG